MQKYILIIVSFLCSIIHAATLTEKGITWTYSVENGVAELGLGLSSTAIPVDTAGDIEIPEKLGGFPVKSLGDFCFRKCSSITSVLIPPGVTNISRAAFDQCSLLRSVSIPDGVLEIGYGAFLYCRNLESLTIPTSVKHIGQNAFSYCDKLGNDVVIVDKCVLTVNGTCPQKVDLPFGTRLIADYAFDGCTTMVSISLPRTIESIGEGAFWECNGLKSVAIPDLVQIIRPKTFGYCGAMAEVRLPSGLLDIGSYCFSDCSSLKSVVIPAAVTNIGCCAFRSCIALDTMVFEGKPPKGLSATHNDFDIGLIRDSMPIYYNTTYSGEWQAVIQECGFTNAKPKQEDGGPYIESVDGIEWTFGVAESMFGGASIGWVFYERAISQNTKGDIAIPAVLGGWPVCHIWANAFSGCSQLTSISIPESVTMIGSCAFDGCSGLVSLTIPSKVTTIESSTFRGCSGLTSISVPSNVTSIGERAFENCYNLKMVDIPPSVSEIRSEAFYNCYKLESMTIQSNVTRISGWAFSGCASLKSLTVPTNVIYIGEYAFENCTDLMSVTFEGAPPKGLVNADINKDAAIRYNATYRDEWLPVIEECGFTNARPYGQAEETVLPSWGSDFAAAKELADRKHMPLVVVWSNQGCSHCELLRRLFDDAAMTDWLTNRYITVDSVGDAEAKQFSRNSTGKFPYVAVYLNEEGTTTNKITFTGRNGTMPVHAGSLMDQFTNSVDLSVAVMRGTGSFPIQRRVTFDANGGECTIWDKLIDDGYSIMTLPTATRFGHEFVGWYTDAVAGERIDGSETISADVTYYAHWEAVTAPVWQYDLTDDYAEVYGCLLPIDFDGRLVFPAEIEGRSRIVIAGESFVGDMNIKTVELSAAVSEGSYPLGWVLFWGCTNIESFVVSDDNPEFTSLNGAVYSKDGRTLVACPRGAKTFTVPAGVTNIATGAFAGCCCLERLSIGEDVVFVDTDALADCEALADIYFYGEPPENWMTLAESAPCVVHYNDAFSIEWKRAFEGFGIIAQPFCDSPDPIDGTRSVRVSFIAPNGVVSVASAAFVTNGVYGLLPAARRDGFTFAGWYTALDGMTRVSEFSQVDPMVKTLFARWVEDDVSLYAQWDANAYTVVFNPNGGSGEMSKQDFLYDQSQSISATTYARAGYTFKGWSRAENGEVVYKDGECVSNLTSVAGFAVALFAQWEKDFELNAEEIEDWLIDDLATKFAAKSGESESSYRKRFKEKFGADYAAAFYKETGKVGQDGTKLQVWHDYMAGTDPLDLTSQFKASITFDENGIPVVEWFPDLNDDGKQTLRKYTTYGCENLGGNWHDMSTVPEADKSNYRFFRVTVEMP